MDWIDIKLEKAPKDTNIWVYDGKAVSDAKTNKPEWLEEIYNVTHWKYMVTPEPPKE